MSDHPPIPLSLTERWKAHTISQKTDLRAKLLDAVARYEGWEESAVALVDEAIMPTLESTHPTPDSLIEKLEAVKHEAPNHPRGIGFNEGLETAVAIVGQHQAKLEGILGAMAVEAEYAENQRRENPAEKDNPWKDCPTSRAAYAIWRRLDPDDKIGKGLGMPHRFYEAAECALKAAGLPKPVSSVMDTDKALSKSKEQEELAIAPEAAGLEARCDRPAPATQQPVGKPNMLATLIACDVMIRNLIHETEWEKDPAVKLVLSENMHYIRAASTDRE